MLGAWLGQPMGVDFSQPEYNESTQVHAGIRLIGEAVEPDAITLALGIPPSRILTGDERPSQQPGWFLNTAGRVDSTELRDHIRHLTDQLLPVRDQFIAACTRHHVEPSLFCFASNPTSASIGLDADTIESLAALGLDYEVDLYVSDPTAEGHCHIREHRQRLIERLNASVRRPEMYGSHQAETDLRDLAFIDRSEQRLESLGAKLAERGWWSSTGFVGALEQTFGDLPCARSIRQAPIVEVGLELGWIELDRQLARADYWRLANHSLGWLESQPRSSQAAESEFGSPSIRIGGRWEASLGFATDDFTLPLIWFDVGREGEIVSLRRAGDTILQEFIAGQPSGFDAGSAASNISARKHASNPFRRSS